ncbi:DNA cytosine methyltransferase [Haloarcula litorea]|uniref:DNA cytosine methyltransferase n=1 Tax=Haloarcula litorea TaxID=3032579 RepID=UPI0023E7EF0B|nr:DNA cytosine methyltransferase [Halomicroarcula sp. GDY20]
MDGATADEDAVAAVLDLFCGGGGLSTGFEQAGYDVVAGVDVNEDFLPTFEHNHEDSLAIQADLGEVDPAAFYDDHDIDTDAVDVVVGGPPCKGFSIAGKRDPEDERNSLVGSFIDHVAHVEPDVFVMENVPGIKSMEDGDVVRKIHQRYEEIGYSVKHETLNAADYGVPQARRRVVFVGRADGEVPTFPDRTHRPSEQTTLSSAALEPYVTVREALVEKEIEGLPNHETTDHSDDMVERIAEVDHGDSLYESFGDSWRRLEPDEPAFTVKENHNAPFIHPTEDRVGTVRECAILQTFPDDYEFQGPKSTQLKIVGNAVPVRLGRVVAEAVREDLAEMRDASVTSTS